MNLKINYININLITYIIFLTLHYIIVYLMKLPLDCIIVFTMYGVTVRLHCRYNYITSSFLITYKDIITLYRFHKCIKLHCIIVFTNVSCYTYI